VVKEEELSKIVAEERVDEPPKEDVNSGPKPKQSWIIDSRESTMALDSKLCPESSHRQPDLPYLASWAAPHALKK
jgi:hypothetical protein